MNKPWTKNYDPSVPHTIDPDQYVSIPDMLEECFKKYADFPCFMNFGETLTYKQVDELSQAYAGFLQTEYKLQKGDRVAIMMPNCLQYPVALFGCLRAGMVNVNINPLYTTIEEIGYVLRHAEVKCILTLANFAHLIQQAIVDTRVKHVIVTEIGDLFPFPKRLLFNFVVNYIKKMVPSWEGLNAIPFRETIDPLYQSKFTKPALCGEDIAYLQFTEGRETGRPKCAMITHRNFIANGLQNSAWFSAILEPRTIALATTPFCKLTLLAAHCLAFMTHGIANNLITDPRNIDTLVNEIKKHTPSIIISVRSILNNLIFDENFQKIDFSPLKTTFASGMPISQALVERWQSITQSTITECYALTEGSPAIAINPILSKNVVGSLGLPIPSTEIKICNEEGEEVPIGSRGEIWIKGPQVIQSYWNQPEVNKKAFTEDGWFKTSDMGYMDEEGYFYFINRKEDLIETKSGIVYPSEVENVIHELNDINDVVVVARKSKNKSVIIRAYIIKDDSSSSEKLSEESIITHCKRYLLDYQVPHEIRFITEFPYSTTRFILKRILRNCK